MVRELSSRLWSNPLATPVHVNQDRGFREGVLVGDITIDHEWHTLKFGGDVRVNDIREMFQLAAPGERVGTDLTARGKSRHGIRPSLHPGGLRCDSVTYSRYAPSSRLVRRAQERSRCSRDFRHGLLSFQDERRSTEISLFVQNQVRLGNFATHHGIRFDRYRLLVADRAFSPRLALSYYVPKAEIQLFASYDRIFQPPPMENLLLSSGAPALGIDTVEGNLAVPPSRANFFEVGLRKNFGNVVRLDLNHYWRTFRNYIDDDVFLNTGVSFPISFDTARIEGTEVRLELPRWGRLSSFASYSNLLGRATSPVTGGLFIEGGEAEELRDIVERFPISQDQRNTAAARFFFDLHRRVWIGFGARYGSGLPVELAGDDDDEEVEAQDDETAGPEYATDEDASIPLEILQRVNFRRARIRPNFSLDFSVGARLWERNTQSVSVQFDLRNATDRLNVINFNGLFSGTALAPGRQATLRLKMRFQ